jgi:hypothetical protein
MKRADLARPRLLWLLLLGATLVGGIALGCSVAPADREAITRAWAERDAERERECQQRGGKWVAGGCVFGPGS